jgi:hypothetical protein
MAQTQNDAKFNLDGSVNVTRGAAVHDECDNPLEITDLGRYALDISGNTTNGTDPGFSCQAGGSTNFQQSTWMTFTAIGSGTVTLELCDSGPGGDGTTDTLLGVYTGDCGGTFTEVACGEDDCNGLNAAATFNAVAGTTYYIVAADWGLSPDATELFLDVSGDSAVFVNPIPTLGEWGLIVFITLLAGASIVMMRRQRATA